MADISERNFHEEKVEIDGNTYRACLFDGCTMVFRGGGVPSFSFCSFERCTWMTTVPVDGPLFALLTAFSGGKISTETVPGTLTPPNTQS
jgi:hypothetical protein